MLHALASTPPPEVRSSADVGTALIPIVLRSVAMIGQYVLPLLFTVGAILSGIRSFCHRGTSGLAPSDGLAQGNSNVIAIPACPKCNAPTVQRRARRGNNAGEIFWGCAHYPGCKGTCPLA